MLTLHDDSTDPTAMTSQSILSGMGIIVVEEFWYNQWIRSIQRWSCNVSEEEYMVMVTASGMYVYEFDIGVYKAWTNTAYGRGSFFHVNIAGVFDRVCKIDI